MLSLVLMKTAVFIEKDGILNGYSPGSTYPEAPTRLEDFVIQKELAPNLVQLKAAGYLLIVTTNQPGISQGTLNRRDLDRMCQQLLKEFPLDDILVCPHDEQDHCPCRKPKPGLFLEAAFKWQINLEQSFVVSSRWQDAEAARQIGCTSILIDSPWVRERRHDWIAQDFNCAVQKIIDGKTIHQNPIMASI